MSYLSEIGLLSLGSQLKALSDRLYAMADEVYKRSGSPLQARWFPVLRLLLDRGPQSVGEVAATVGWTHSAVSQLAGRLERDGWIVAEADAADRRVRRLALTERAAQAVREAEPIWRAIELELGSRARRADADVADALQKLETILDDGLAAAVTLRVPALRAGAVEIVPFAPEWREHFYRLNADWLERYFHLEQVDHEVLSQPEEKIIAPGGRIFFARLNGAIVGTCALMPAGPGEYELTKMAVDPAVQGVGLGRRLIEAAIAAFEEMDGTTLFLESNSKLAPAIRLYESVGFEHQPALRSGSHYQRANVYMIWRGRTAA